MVLQMVSGLFDRVHLTWLVVKQTKAKGGLSLCTTLGTGLSNLKDLGEVFDGLGNVTVLALNVSEALIGATQLVIVLSF